MHVPPPPLDQIRHVDKLAVGAECYLQAALLYTTVAGERRIRVHTVALTVSDSVSLLFKNADLDAQTTVMARRLAAALPGGTLAAARESVTANSVATLAAYRKHCASSSSAVQLILPEALKLLPLYALALLKGPALRVRMETTGRASNKPPISFFRHKLDHSQGTPSGSRSIQCGVECGSLSIHKLDHAQGTPSA